MFCGTPVTSSASVTSQPIAMALKPLQTQPPAAYSPSPLPGAQHTDVDQTDPEYLSIRRDMDTAGLEMTRLVRLSNTILKDKFDSESSHLNKVKMHGFSLNIQNLYHGTTAPFEQICDEGLDERLGRRGRFGRGIYFSDNPVKCCKYSEYKTSQPYLLRCKVILGDIKEYALKEQDKMLTREPIKTVKDGKRVYYDSVKGQPVDHMEYVIYDKRRALIEYIAFYDPPAQPADQLAKPDKLRSRSNNANASVKHVPSSSSMSSAGELSDTAKGGDTSGNGASFSDEDSGGSGRNSPVGSGGSDSEMDTDDLHSPFIPVYTDTTAVPRVALSRVRHPRKDMSDSGIPSSSQNSSAAAAAAAAAAVTSSVLPPTAPTSLASRLPADVASDLYSSPHLQALRQLLGLKGKIPDHQLDLLTKEYHRTYGTQGGAQRVDDDDPVSEVMSKLVQEFQDVTQCSDVANCRRYIQLGDMDLNRAVEAYMDANT